MSDLQENRWIPRLERLEDRETPSAGDILVTGPGFGGGPQVRTFDATTGAANFSVFAYGTVRCGARVAAGDINGDGVQDTIAAPGPGVSPLIRVYNGANGALMRQFYAYSIAWQGGVYVASGDINNDGFDDIVTGADIGGGPQVRAFSGRNGAELANFFAYSFFFPGGVRVGTGDINNDGFDEIITGAGPGGGPHVRAFDIRNGLVIRDFFAYSPFFAGGVFVSGGDVTGDGVSEIVTGAGFGGGPQVNVYDGVTGALFRSFFAYSSLFRGGVTVAVTDVNNDGVGDIITGPGPGMAPNVRAFHATTLLLLTSFNAYPAGFLGGVFVGGTH